MFNVLLYYDSFNTLVDIVTNMKKIGIDVASHQSPNQVITQVIEFNADFVIMQAGKDPLSVYEISSKLVHLAKSPTVLLIKSKDQKLDPNDLVTHNIAKVFSEPLDLHALLAYLLEVKGFNPVEYFNKYLQIEYVPKKAITPRKGKIDDKFKNRDYSKKYLDVVDEVDDSDISVTFDLEKVKNITKKINEKEHNLLEETDKDKFMKALLTEN